MNWEAVTERIKYHENGMAALWVWGFTIITAVMFAVVFQQLYELGAIGDADVEMLSTVLTALVIVGVLGFALHVLHVLTGTLAYFQERDSS